MHVSSTPPTGVEIPGPGISTLRAGAEWDGARQWGVAMHLPTYWAKGRHNNAVCWRWSDLSQADAQASADAHAIELDALLAAGQHLDRYNYGAERPLREELIERQPGIAITRNAYGALVLNADRAMFVDLDFADDESREPALLAKLRAWTTTHQLAVRAYRTAAGLRALVTNQTFDPVAPATEALLTEVGCDPLYVKLCRIQSSFRARLTPKPWRVGKRPPKIPWPFENGDAEQRLRDWVADYTAASEHFGACRFVEAIGTGVVDPELAPVLALHDGRACGGQQLA